MLARERKAQSRNELRLNLLMTPTRPSQARSPQGGVPAAGWTLFPLLKPISLRRRCERAGFQRLARGAKNRAPTLLVSEFDQPLRALARPAMRRAFFIPG